MDPLAAKYLAVGIATLALWGIGIGLGNLFSSYLSGSLRNPSAAPKVFGALMISFALTEALALFALLIALLLLFAV